MVTALALAGPLPAAADRHLAAAATMQACIAESDCFATIEDAVAASVSGDRIDLAEGTHDVGGLVIEHDLTIVGAGTAATVLRPTEGRPGLSAADAWWYVQRHGTLQLSDLSFDGEGFDVGAAVRSDGVLNVQRVAFDSIFDTSTEGQPDYWGVGVYVRGGDGPARLVAEDVTFTNIGRIGIIIFGADAEADITRLDYRGKGETDGLDYGVEVAAGASATISDSTVTRSAGTAVPEGWTSAAVLVTDYYGPGTSVTVRGGSFTDNTTAVAVGLEVSDASAVTVTGANIVGNGWGVTSTNPDAPTDARNNWWGDRSGPGDVGPGSGDLVSSGVQYEPWCTSPGCVAPPPPPPPPPAEEDASPPPIVPLPSPSDSPDPIDNPEGGALNRQPGESGAVVAGRLVPTETKTVPTPPAGDRSEADRTQARARTRELTKGLLAKRLPVSGAGAAAPPVSVFDTDDGSAVIGLMAGPDGLGRPVPGEQVVVVDAGSAGLIVAGGDAGGAPFGLTADRAMSTVPGGRIGAVGIGFEPGGQGQLVMLSTPRLLGRFTAGADGSFKGLFSVPRDLEPGPHTLVVNGPAAGGAVTLMLGIIVDEPGSFSDVVATSPHGAAIAALKALENSIGFPDGTYRPAESVTRGQLAAFVAQVLALEPQSSVPGLSDVAGAHAEAINSAVHAGIFRGFPDGTFRPALPVTRGQMATLLAGAADLDPGTVSEVGDAVGAHAGSIHAVIGSGLARGYPDATFRPDRPVTRAQTATFLMNLADRSVGRALT